jgi:alkylated DNA repair dioxygenase AlkB
MAAASSMEQEAALLVQSSIDLGERGQLGTLPLDMQSVTVIRGDSRRDFQHLRIAAHKGNCGTKE